MKMKSKLAELLLMSSVLTGSIGSNYPSVRRGYAAPNGNSRRLDKENVARKRKRVLAGKARSINHKNN